MILLKTFVFNLIMHHTVGKYILITGLIIVLIGVLVYFLGDKLKWFGSLPGDIKLEKGNVKIFFPVVTMILLSLILTLLINLFKKFF